MSIDNKDEFEETKMQVMNLIKGKKEVNSETDYKFGGIYMIYIDNFENSKILPIYIGKTLNFQERHKTHLTNLLSINRLRKEDYINYILNNKYEGHYLYCKLFKYMVDNNCTLKNIHMVILEEIQSDEERQKVEHEYITKLNASFYGFNQLNSISLYPRNINSPVTIGLIREIREDINKLVKYSGYGFCYFNYYKAFGIFNSHLKNETQKINNEKNYMEYYQLVNKLKQLTDKFYNAKNSIKKEREKCKEILNIEEIFERNNLKSKEKIDSIMAYLLNNDKSVEKSIISYLNRYAKNKNILETIKNDNEKTIYKTKKEIDELGKIIRQTYEEIYKTKITLNKDIIPEKEYVSHILKDNYKDVKFFNERNVLYINVEYSNSGRDVWSSCEIIKIDYEFNNKKDTFFIKNSFDNWFDNNKNAYYLAPNLYSFRFDPFSIKSTSEGNITTSMEYYNGINEYTLKDKEKNELQSVLKKIFALTDNEDVKVSLRCKCKRRFKDLLETYEETIIVKKLKRCCR